MLSNPFMCLCDHLEMEIPANKHNRINEMLCVKAFMCDAYVDLL